MSRCPACGAIAPEGFAFCGRCGASLTAVPTRQGDERRVVTVLFCDLVGFTASSDQADPEDVFARLSGWPRRARCSPGSTPAGWSPRPTGGFGRYRPGRHAGCRRTRDHAGGRRAGEHASNHAVTPGRGRFQRNARPGSRSPRRDRHSWTSSGWRSPATPTPPRRCCDRSVPPAAPVPRGSAHRPGGRRRCLGSSAPGCPLDRLTAKGCPPIDTYSFDFGPFTISGAPGTDEAPVAYGPRRTVLDKLLVDAASGWSSARTDGTRSWPVRDAGAGPPDTAAALRLPHLPATSTRWTGSPGSWPE
jgi:hypothetical protein